MKYNLGTPQEMIDEERDFYESIGETPPEHGCLILWVVMVLILLILIVISIL